MVNNHFFYAPPYAKMIVGSIPTKTNQGVQKKIFKINN